MSGQRSQRAGTVSECLQEAECQPCSAGKCTHLGHRGADGQADLCELFQKLKLCFPNKGHYGMSHVNSTHAKLDYLSLESSLCDTNNAVKTIKGHSCCYSVFFVLSTNLIKRPKPAMRSPVSQQFPTSLPSLWYSATSPLLPQKLEKQH